MDSNTQVALAGFAVGLGFGAAARWSGFCLRGAVEDALTQPEAPRARGWMRALDPLGFAATQHGAVSLLLGSRASVRMRLSRAVHLRA